MHSVRVSLAKSKLTILQPATVSFAKLYTNNSPPLPPYIVLVTHSRHVPKLIHRRDRENFLHIPAYDECLFLTKNMCLPLKLKSSLIIR